MATWFVLGTKAYIGTGTNGTRQKDFWEYDFITNLWTQRSDFGGTVRLAPLVLLQATKPGWLPGRMAAEIKKTYGSIVSKSSGIDRCIGFVHVLLQPQKLH